MAESTKRPVLAVIDDDEAVGRLIAKIFQDENYDHIIRHEKDYREKLWYLILNPVEAGLIAKAKNYPYLYCPAIGKV